MRITRKSDYAVRAVVALARADADAKGVLVTREHIAASEDIPPAYLDDILRQLRNGGIVRSTRGAVGGWTINQPAAEITIGNIIRVLEGPLASVGGIRPENIELKGGGEHLVTVWFALRSSIRAVLDHVTVADLVSGQLPAVITDLAAARTEDPWTRGGSAGRR